MIVSDTGPKIHTRAVILSGDKNVVDFARFVFWQIALNEPERNYDLVFCTPDKGLDARHPKLPDIRVCEVDTGFLDTIPHSARIPVASNLKLALPILFENDYKQIIHLDTDVFLRKAKMSELFAAADESHAVSAVLDKLQWIEHISDRQKNIWKKLGIDHARYLNAGVLVYNTALFCEQKILEGIIEFTAENLPNFQFYDQDSLNGYLKGNWAPLSLRWNWQMTENTAGLVDEFDPYILHFIWKSKPYLQESPAFSRKYLKEYTTFFEQILGKDLPRNIQKNVWGRTGRWGDCPSVPCLVRALNTINPVYYIYNGILRYVAKSKTRAYCRRLEAALPAYDNSGTSRPLTKGQA